MNDSPSVAIVVTAFNRRTYFSEAVESALRAAAAAGASDVLLLRNFEDPKTDAHWVERGVRLVSDLSPDVGGTLYCALDHCEADYLAFVDDDDLVLPHHLQRFVELRRSVPTVQYYHNRYATFAGAAPSSPAPASPAAAHPRGSGTPWSVYRAADGEPFLRFLAQTNRERNLSSTILHRSVLERARPELSGVSAMSDTAALVAGLTSGGPLVFDTEVTTLVRRHRQNVSKTLSNSRGRSADLERFSQLIARSPEASVAQEYLELRRAREVVYNRVFGVSSSPAETRNAMGTLRDSWRRFHVWRDIGFLGIGGIALTVPAALPALRAALLPN